MLLCVDPGVRASGVAVFSRDRGLVLARYIAKDELLGLARDVAVFVSEVLIEMPRIYPHSDQRKGDLNDLLDLAAVVGYFEGWFAARGVQVRRIAPADWKGQVPKKIMTERIRSKITPLEVQRISELDYRNHNVIDAIGMGLWHLKRS